MKKLLFIIFITTFLSCTKEEMPTEANPNSDDIVNFYLRGFVDFSILNQDREDLFDSNTINFLSVDSMLHYYNINDSIIEVLDINQTHPRNLWLLSGASPILMRVGLHTGYEGLVSETDGIKTGYSISYIKFNNQLTDTIKVEWEAMDGKYFRNKKVWYNNVYMGSAEDVFQITK